jgi:hypothetical protein
MPYATKAIIQHEFVVNLLNIYVEFRHPMDITVKPADTVWIIYLDGVETPITSSIWLDQFTMQLIIESVAAEPDRVLVTYDGPDPLLITSWDKQWEPWAAIPSYSGWPTTFKFGMIILWHGSVASIPAGWHLCDGTENTPDLRNKFIVGAGSTYNPAAVGGNLTHTHAATQGQHRHTIIPGVGQVGGAVISNVTDYQTPTITVPSTNHLPPYYSLCYIMKL